MARAIFRQAALDRLSSPEQLDLLMQVTSPRGWLALTALLCLLAIALVWGIVGSVATTVEGTGILLRPGGVHAVVAPRAGLVTNVLVQVDKTVFRNDVVARLAAAEPSKPEPEKALNSHRQEGESILSTGSGHIVEILVKEGTFVEAGTPLIVIEPVDLGLEAVLYIPLAEGRKVRPGMAVEITPSTVKKKEMGYMIGEVEAVAAFPSSRQGMMRTLENDELARALTASGPVLRVVARLLPDADRPGSYRWSSAAGPPFKITSGTACRSTITVRRQRPISLLVPSVRELMGI
ncbi:MAG: NHLP bacteriocin system secretion protein [Gemmataceae bacterium]